jgi:hypothetical protein
MMFEKLQNSAPPGVNPGQRHHDAGKLIAVITLDRPQARVNIIQFRLNDFVNRG